MRSFGIVILGAVLALVSPALAGEDQSGDFDYYVLALSWQPSWCAREGDARAAPECAAGHGHGWVLHGLWPQYERGWPDFCPTSERAPSRAMTRDMSGIMGSAGLAWYQWRKHGTCSGLSAEEYLSLSRRAYGSLTRPEVFRQLDDPVRLPARVVEEAFLKANPGIGPDMLTVTCQTGRIAELRICLTRDLTPRRCGLDARRDCTLSDALFDPIR